MSTIYQAIKELFISAVRFAIAYAVFAYIGEFQGMQSVLLAVLALCAIDGYRAAIKLLARQEPKFIPFWVSVSPNWYAICRDSNLTDVERWEEFLEETRGDAAKYSVFRDGLNFTMLGQELFFSNDHKTFFSELDFRIQMEEFPADGEFKLFKPSFYVKRKATESGHRVIEFGVVTPDSIKKSVHPRDDRDEIPLAKLPEIEFFALFHNETYHEQARRIDAEREQRLAEYDWEREKGDDEDSWLNWPVALKHKYFRISYREV